MELKKKVVIDCDPGIDDCMALMLCFKHLDVMAVTAVGGNTALEYTQRNARYMTEICGKPEVPVYAGYDQPMFGKTVRAAYAHGSGGLGNVTISDPEKKLGEGHAIDRLIDIFMNNDDVTLVALGPLTNVAQAILKEPRLKERIPEILCMGGSGTAGNFSAAAEFNIYVDPEAAKIVFESGIPIRMVGLNLTRQNRIDLKDVEEIRSIGNKVSDFAAEMLEFSAGADGRCSLCDACTVVWLIDPEIIKKSLHVHVDVETKGEFTRGMTVCDWREYMDMDPKQDIAHEKVAEHPFAGMKEPNVEVAMEFDQPRFRKLLMDTLRMYG